MRPAHVRSLALVLLLAAALPARAQDTQTLEKTGTQIARFNKPGALFAYLRDQAPEFFEVADQAGLAGAIDGSQDAARFQQRFEQLLRSSSLSNADKAKARAEADVAFKLVQTIRAQTGEHVGLSAAQVKAGAKTKALRDQVWDASKHWFNDVWNPDHVNTVPIRFVPDEYELAWTNPNATIPELGIKAGVELTKGQKKQVLDLFAVASDPDKADNPTHTAAAPIHVGRAVNPNPALTIVVNGDVRSDLVLKGGGRNGNMSRGDGSVDYAETMLETQFSENLIAAGANNYDALFVLRSKTRPDKAIIVRVPRTPLRGIDLMNRGESGFWFENNSGLTADEMKKTVEHLANEAAIREGKPSMSIAEWAGKWLPENVGKNMGILSELGIFHGRLKWLAGFTASNHGLGELVDWGDNIYLTKPGVDQREYVWPVVEKIIEKVNADIAGVAVDLAKAKAALDAGFEAGRAATVGKKFRLDTRVISELSDQALEFLGRGASDGNHAPLHSDIPSPSYSVDSGVSRDEALSQLEKTGHTYTGAALAKARGVSRVSDTRGLAPAIADRVDDNTGPRSEVDRGR